MKNLYALSVLLIILTASCSKNYYVASDFEEKTVDHQSIAILPVEMIFTGKMPKELTPEDIIKIEEEESRMYMISLYDAVLSSTKGGKKPIRVDVQSFSQTIRILEDEGLSIRDAWVKKPTELATILGVDAVLQSRIHRKRFMSDLASYGVNVGVQVAEVLMKRIPGVNLPNNLDSTNEIKANFTLIEGTTGSVLYSQAFTADADWNSPPEAIVNSVTNRFAKNFPYRN